MASRKESKGAEESLTSVARLRCDEADNIEDGDIEDGIDGSNVDSESEKEQR